jgi:hypothetical protein
MKHKMIETAMTLHRHHYSSFTEEYVLQAGQCHCLPQILQCPLPVDTPLGVAA